MPPPAPPELVARARELARTLGSAEAAYVRLRAEGHEVSARGVRNWVARGPSSPPPSLRQSPSPPSPRCPPAAPRPPHPLPLPAELEFVDVTTLGWSALAGLAQIVGRFRAKAEADDAPKVFADLVRLEVDVHDRLERLRPPVPIDPELDPTHLASADLLMVRLGRLITESETAPA